MFVLVQRVLGNTHITSEINGNHSQDSFEGPGLVALWGWEESDSEDYQKKEDWLLPKIFGLRVFPDKDGKMNLNLEQYCEQQSSSGGILWVPQFTLAATMDSGFRPSFTKALHPNLAKIRFHALAEKIKQQPQKKSIKNCFGVFGADMKLTFTNWGPLTIPLVR